MKFIIILISYLITLTSTFAYTSEDIQMTYKKLNENAQIYCQFKNYVSRPQIKAINTEFIKNQYLKTSFQTNNIFFNVKVSMEGRDAVAEIQYQHEMIKGKLKKNFEISFNRNEINFYPNGAILKDLALNLLCVTEVAVEKNYSLDSTPLHINVHPHGNYDQNNLTTDKIHTYFETFKSLSLLDDYNRKGEGYSIGRFIEDGFASLNHKYYPDPSFEIPETSDLLVAPAGHLKYDIDSIKSVIHYTGGNHNYCMWNNIRRVIDGLFASTSGEEIVFIFHTNVIVTQRPGIISDISIPKNVYKKSYVLADIFKNMNAREYKDYHDGYVNFFLDDLGKFKNNFFKTLEIVYNGKSYTLNGKGLKDYRIEFIYK